MDFRKFERKDFLVYQSWFKDHWLNVALGPMDEAWLEHILHDESGTQYAVFVGEDLMAVVGVVWANDAHPFHTITDLAIRPDQRRRGLGQQVLDRLVHQVSTPSVEAWVTHVDSKNPKAIDFMKKSNWNLIEKGSMYTFRLNYSKV